MAITSASIEANGWVLRVTHTAGLGSFASYALDPNGMPRLTLASTAPGFVQSGGAAVTASVPRLLIATKPLRLPVQATNAGVRSFKAIDETDLGGGVTRVRIALSSHVYATDTGLTLTAAAGWRSGEGATSGIAVSNGSTVAAPAPIVRWADVPYQLQGGSFDLEVVAVSHHPNGLAPVAGVKFTVTDGTTVRTLWTTALATSTSYSAGGTGQPLRVYRVTVDPAAAPALTKGLLRCDFEVCPWLGPAQKSDAAGTRSMTALGTAAMATSAFVPFVVAYNPANGWIVPRYAYVANGGAGTAAAANVSTSAASAATTPLATINLAIESLRLHAVLNPSVGTVAAANGQAAIAQSLDGCRIRLAPGATPGTGTTTVGTGVATAASWLTIEGDPADPDPRSACIIRSPASVNGNTRVSRIRLANATIEAQTNGVVTALYAWLDGIEVRGVAGQEATNGVPVGATGGLQFITNSKWWRHGTGPTPSGTAVNPVLLRNVAAERTLGAPTVVNCARLPTAVAGSTAIAGASATAPVSDAGLGLERIALGNEFRYLNGAVAFNMTALANAAAPAAFALGRPYPTASRQAFVNNVCEIYGAATPLWGGIGENSAIVATENIIENNSFVGDRTNSFYNDLNLATIALNDSEDCLIRVNRFANNIAMKCATKHDFFNDPAVFNQRTGTGSPYRLSDSRNRALALGAELTANGNIYRVTAAGTTATTGGPSGTGTSIADGSVAWSWFAVQDARQHGYRPQATGAWSSHYGVMYEGNVDFQPPADADPEFLFEFFGIGSAQLSADGVTVTSTPFVLDKSGTSNRLSFQPAPDGTGGGNYKPLAGGSAVYLLGRARSGNVDVDQRSVARSVPFAAGALEGVVAAALLPAADRHVMRAASPAIGWTTTLATARGVAAMRAAAATTAWRTSIVAANGLSGARAATGTAAWRVDIVAASGRLASRGAATATGWIVTLLAANARSPIRITVGSCSWSVNFGPAASRIASLAGQSVAGWSGTLDAANGRLAQFAAPGHVVLDAAWLIVIGSGRIAIRDRTLPLLLPGTLAPPERTLIVAGDFRLTIAD